MANPSVKPFLSCVSDEFGAERDALRHELTGLTVDVAIQEDFVSLGVDTLTKLDAYTQTCDAVVHLVGDMTGAEPPALSVAGLLERHPDLPTKLAPFAPVVDAGGKIPYTQWEAWLAIYYGKPLLIAAPEAEASRGPKFAPTDETRAAQAAHLRLLRRGMARYAELTFATRDQLVKEIFKSLFALFGDRIRRVHQPRNLPFVSLGPLFMGRDRALDDLRAALAAGKGAAVVGRALHGLGGVGKTRLAIEYALRHEAEYSALLFVRADDPATLDANLAALAGVSVLDLEEKEAREDAVKIEAVLRWLDAHPTWLMILDNVDDEKAVAAVDKLMARLKSGHVIVTARAATFPASLRKLELDVLDEDAATEFLLERTRDDRARADDDAANARAIARELDGLALGLEHAGAYIATLRIGCAEYLKRWGESRQKVLDWFGPALTSYDRRLATTWATSVDRLSAESRRLLDRLSMLAPDPIPDSLLDVAVPGEAADYDALEARAGLYGFSLIARATGEDGSANGFVMHRLVQDFARRAMTVERRGEALREALGWIDNALVGDPQDVRSWPVLDPLAPHALAVARRADKAGIAAPTGQVFSQLARLWDTKARYAEAEPLFRRVVEINELAFGGDHPVVATCLNDLASLLLDTNRLGEAERLYRRALAIDEASLGPNHPTVARDLNNLARLLHNTNRLGEAEPLYRRALAIWETSLGPDHPSVATGLNNLASVLLATNRPGEAEPLFRRALMILEKGLGPDHPAVASALNNLAELLRQTTNRLGETEPLYRRALAIEEASYGPDHPNVASALDNLAKLLSRINRLGEAEPLYRRALAIDEASYGSDHPHVALSLGSLASLLHATNRSGEAESLYRRALAINEASYGPDHPRVASALNNLALLLHATNRPIDAEPLFRRAEDRRGELRSGSSRSGDQPQQSRGTTPRNEPPHRRGAAFSPRAGDRRDELRAGSPPRGG